MTRTRGSLPLLAFDSVLATRLVFLRRDNHDHLPTFHLRHLLHGTVFFKVVPDPGFRSCAPKSWCAISRPLNLNVTFVLSPVLEKPRTSFRELDLVITFIRPRTKLDFLDVNLLLLALG